MEKFVLQGRKLNGPPAAREVYATLKQHQLEDEYVPHTHTYLLTYCTVTGLDLVRSVVFVECVYTMIHD